jgi:ornithine cyclodeaminase/alanine dehydrogenase-like protein (mu-crystallin family)
MIAAGRWFEDEIAGELGDVILGRIPARHNDSVTVLFESAGMPMCDATAAAWA